LKTDQELNEEAHEMILKDHADVSDVRDKYLEVMEAFKSEDSPMLIILTQNIVLGLECALLNLDNLINCYVNQQVKGTKNDPIN
jgi:hypothetical protein